MQTKWGASPTPYHTEREMIDDDDDDDVIHRPG